jgi:hypothetical protein
MQGSISKEPQERIKKMKVTKGHGYGLQFMQINPA